VQKIVTSIQLRDFITGVLASGVLIFQIKFAHQHMAIPVEKKRVTNSQMGGIGGGDQAGGEEAAVVGRNTKVCRWSGKQASCFCACVSSSDFAFPSTQNKTTTTVGWDMGLTLRLQLIGALGTAASKPWFSAYSSRYSQIHQSPFSSSPF
jgi:hypothetical protein